MEDSKKALFVKKMGKKRLSLAKGGLLKRKKMGVGGLLGVSGGAGGTGFTTQAGTDANQLSNSYNQNQSALSLQGGQAQTLNPQLGTGVAGQALLNQQLVGMTQGQGPNVAQNQLNQATGANVANQAALMAGQRGAGSNPALIAREAAQQGASTQQQAAGQAATLQAQQQIAAQQALAQLSANEIGQSQNAAIANTGANQNEQNILQGANTANNNVQAGLANTELQGQQGTLGGIINGAGGAAHLFAKGGEVHHGHKKLDFVHKMSKMALEHFDGGGPVLPGAPDAQESMRKAFHFAEGGLAVPEVTIQGPQPAQVQMSMPAQGGFSSGNNAGAQALGNSLKAKPKDPSKKSADQPIPGQTAIPTQNDWAAFSGAPGVTLADQNASMMGGPSNVAPPAFVPNVGPFAVGSSTPMMAQGGMMHPHFQGPHKSMIANYLSKGGPVKAMVSPGEIYLNPEQVHQVVHEGANPLEVGQRFGGKAKVKGDSLKNDTIPTTLQEGGVVIDRENVKNPEKAALFVHRAIAKKKAGRR